MEDPPDYSRILSLVTDCRDLNKLRSFISNAVRKDVTEVRDAALMQLRHLMPQKTPGSFEAAFWGMMDTYHTYLLLHDRPVRRLSKTWDRALEEGEVATLIHWVEKGEQAWALQQFIERGDVEKTAEKLMLKYPKRFDAALRKKAKQRLTTAIPALVRS